MGTMGILKVQSFGERDTSLVLAFYWNAMIWIQTWPVIKRG
jgi:hypothetical protein